MLGRNVVPLRLLLVQRVVNIRCSSTMGIENGVRLQKVFPISSSSEGAVLQFDAAKATATYAKFLQLIDQDTYRNEMFLNRAINRYEKYFRLAHYVYKQEGLNALEELVPTRDISMVWATHMIHPHNYRSWRKQYFDGCEGKKLAVNTWFSNQTIRIKQHTKEESVNTWKQRYDTTSKHWEKLFHEEYLFSASQPTLPRQTKLMSNKELEGLFGIDLVSAVQRHLRFGRRVVKLKPLMNREYFEIAVERYLNFLSLAPDIKGPLVPTLDIDLVWHSHMLSPIDYFPDCERLAGRVLDHNDSMPNNQLKKAFEDTQLAWERKKNSKMVKTQKKKKENSSSCGSCGSCGFGDSIFHNDLIHHNAESHALAVAEEVGAVNNFDDYLIPKTAVSEGGISEPIMWTEDPSEGISEANDSSWWNFSWDFFSSSDSNSGSNDSASSCSSCSSCGGD